MYHNHNQLNDQLSIFRASVEEIRAENVRFCHMFLATTDGRGKSLAFRNAEIRQRLNKKVCPQG